MVDVIKRGQIPEEKVHEVTCGHCRSELRFRQGEAKIVGDQRDGEYMQIECPVCKRNVCKALYYPNTMSWKDH